MIVLGVEVVQVASSGGELGASCGVCEICSLWRFRSLTFEIATSH